MQRHRRRPVGGRVKDGQCGGLGSDTQRVGWSEQMSASRQVQPGVLVLGRWPSHSYAMRCMACNTRRPAPWLLQCHSRWQRLWRQPRRRQTSSLRDRVGQAAGAVRRSQLVKLQEGEHREVGGWAWHLLRSRRHCYAAWHGRCCVKSARMPQLCSGCWAATGESKPAISTGQSMLNYVSLAARALDMVSATAKPPLRAVASDSPAGRTRGSRGHQRTIQVRQHRHLPSAGC